MIISLATCYVTLDSQYLDRFYREAAIRPALVLNMPANSNTLLLNNDGVGPAVVTNFTIYPKVTDSNKAYLSSLDSEPSVDDIKFEGKSLKNIIIALVDQALNEEDFYSDAIPELEINKIVTAAQLVVPGITPTEKVEIFKVDSGYLLEYVEKYKEKLPLKDYLHSKFVARTFILQMVSRANIDICYCSITGLYCTGHKSSGLCEQRRINNSSPVQKLLGMIIKDRDTPSLDKIISPKTTLSP